MRRSAAAKRLDRFNGGRQRVGFGRRLRRVGRRTAGIAAAERLIKVHSGDKPVAFERALPVLRLMGPNVVLQGGPGSGQHTKLCNQILIASTMIGVVECLLYGARSGLDLTRLIDIVGSGAAASWSLNNLGRRIVQGEAIGTLVKE